MVSACVAMNCPNNGFKWEVREKRGYTCKLTLIWSCMNVCMRASAQHMYKCYPRHNILYIYQNSLILILQTRNNQAGKLNHEIRKITLTTVVNMSYPQYTHKSPIHYSQTSHKQWGENHKVFFLLNMTKRMINMCIRLSQAKPNPITEKHTWHHVADSAINPCFPIDTLTVTYEIYTTTSLLLLLFKFSSYFRSSSMNCNNIFSIFCDFFISTLNTLNHILSYICIRHTLHPIPETQILRVHHRWGESKCIF